MLDNILTVRQLNLYVRTLIESDIKLNNITVKGELSNFKNHYASGHWYFTLKDSDSQIRCVMFKMNASRVKFEPTDGLEVVLKGRVSLYEKDGQYQFYCEEMNSAGFGDIALRFEQIKEKLKNEGLFDQSSKRPLPKFPKKIAVLTSATGAAVKDIINVLSRRYPLCEIMLCPVSVQGDNAVPEMLEALESVYIRTDTDLIIIGRGGGSIEDLWAFNDERLARKIYESPIPVISAVGHETDFTICDFVADLRAPTPSAAAELAVPDVAELNEYLLKTTDKLKLLLKNKYEKENTRFSLFCQNLIFKNPLDMLVNRKGENLHKIEDKLTAVVGSIISKKEIEFTKNISLLDNLSPLKTMARGYTLVCKNGVSVKSIDDFSLDDSINLTFSDGNADCKVINKYKKV